MTQEEANEKEWEAWQAQRAALKAARTRAEIVVWLAALDAWMEASETRLQAELQADKEI